MQTKTLFSHHYLETRLPEHPEWADDPRPLLAQIRRLWQEAVAYGARWNEAQTETEFIRPVLDLLGWSYIPQTKAGHGSQVTRPDYALFEGRAAKTEAMLRTADGEKPLAVQIFGSDPSVMGRAAAIGYAHRHTHSFRYAHTRGSAA